MSDQLVILGKQIRQIRDEKKINLEEISANLKIPVKFLNQIEEGDLIDSISNATTLLFVKSYLEFLGDDSKDLVKKYKQCFAQIKRNRTLDECVVKHDQSPRLSDFKIAIVSTIFLLILSHCYFSAEQEVGEGDLSQEQEVLFVSE